MPEPKDDPKIPTPPTDDPPADPPADPPDDDGENGEEETPAWAKGLSEGVSKLSERLNSIEEQIKTEPAPAPATDGGFTPDHEKGKYFAPDYKPKSYNEFAKKMLDIADKRRTHAEEVRTKQEQNWNAEWDKQLDQLTKEKKIPEVKDPNDPKDPGKKARAQLLIDAAKAGSSDLISFYNVTSKYKKGKPATPPSAVAPVGGEKGGGGGGKGKRTYKDTKKSIEQVKAEKYPDLT